MMNPVIGIQLVYGCSALYSSLGSTYTELYHQYIAPSVAAPIAHCVVTRRRWSISSTFFIADSNRG